MKYPLVEQPRHGSYSRAARSRTCSAETPTRGDEIWGPDEYGFGPSPAIALSCRLLMIALRSGGIHGESLSIHESLKVVHLSICHGLENIDTKRARELVPVLAKDNLLLDPRLAVQSAGKGVIAEGEMVESKSPRSDSGPHSQTEVLRARGSTSGVCNFGAVTMPLLISEVQ